MLGSAAKQWKWKNKKKEGDRMPAKAQGKKREVADAERRLTG